MAINRTTAPSTLKLTHEQLMARLKQIEAVESLLSELSLHRREDTPVHQINIAIRLLQEMLYDNEEDWMENRLETIYEKYGVNQAS